MVCVQVEYCASVLCPTAWFSTSTAFLLPRSWVIYFAFFSGVMGSIYNSTFDQPRYRTRGALRGLTEFPMTRTRLLKVLRVKVGKVSTERTGHLGVVALVSAIDIREHTGSEGECITHKGDHLAPTGVVGQSKDPRKSRG